MRWIAGRGGGGGGLHFRDPPDVFADAAARLAAFQAMGTLDGQHTQFVADRSLAIIIGTLAVPVSFQTYVGDAGDYDDSMWVARTDAVRGPPGPGPTDAQVSAAVTAGVKPYARVGGRTIAPTDADDDFMLDAEFTSAATIALITGNIQFSDIAGMIADGQVPASFTRDAERTRASIAGILGITEAQVDEILVGTPTLNGNILTFRRADGSAHNIVLPMATGADGRLRFGTAAPAANLGVDGDSYVFVDSTNEVAVFYEKAAGAWVERFKAPLAEEAQDHTRRAAISADLTLTTAEVNAGTSSTTSTVRTPMWGIGVIRNLFIGVPTDENDISDILFNGLSQFANYIRLQDESDDDIVVEGHKWWYTADLDGEYYSQVNLEIRQA